MVYSIDWEVGFSNRADEAPSRWVPAVVPGAVQLDWARAEQWDSHVYGDNWQQYTWMEDKYWIYRTLIKVPPLGANEKLIFVSQGIDYSFLIRLNGKELLRQEGMFTPVELEITGILGETAELEIVLDPAPKRADAPISRSQADQSCKPAASYGWDWHPRLIPLGIWDETYLTVRPAVHLTASELRYDLNESLSLAELNLRIEFNDVPSGELTWKLLDPDGQAVLQHTGLVEAAEFAHCARIENPQLWWPHDQGEQPLYTSEVSFIPCGGSVSERQCLYRRVGFRRVKLVVHEGGWVQPTEFPKSRSLPPITMEINNRTIFCKGTNWIQPDIFPGRISSENYRSLLELAKAAHMNLLRSWGGCIVNKASFFEQCDEMGIMVWQEFPLACNLYPDSPAYLKVLDQESRSIITRLRKHASVVLWCGGNELFNSWSKMTDQSLPLRLLNANCYALDPNTPFIMTSPLEGMGHGHYMFRYRTGEDVLEAMPKARNTAYTEFGVPSPSSVEQLKSFIPEEQLYPPKPGTAWETHHAFNALSEEMWLMEDQLFDYFGPWESLEQLVERGQLLQSEGYKCIYEEARRQKPHCAMALNWCYNEPWPTAANNSIIMWPDKPKPAYYAVQASCRPVLASARIPKFVWQEGEWFEPELWMLNDSPRIVPAGRVNVFLTLSTGERHLLLTWDYAAMNPNENQRGPTARYQLPTAVSGRMKLALMDEDRPYWNSEYTILFRSKSEPEQPAMNALNMQ